MQVDNWPGITESLEIIQKYVPMELVCSTGTEVFDWFVPPEWKLNKATLHTEDGELVLMQVNNVHVLKKFSERYQTR